MGILALGYYLQRKRSLAAGFSLEWFQTAWFVSILSGMVFARLFHFIFWDTENFLANPSIILSSFGGFAPKTVIHGWLSGIISTNSMPIQKIHWL